MQPMCGKARLTMVDQPPHAADLWRSAPEGNPMDTKAFLAKIEFATIIGLITGILYLWGWV